MMIKCFEKVLLQNIVSPFRRYCWSFETEWRYSYF